jgi:Ca-activated chloride channel family protein
MSFGSPTVLIALVVVPLLVVVYLREQATRRRAAAAFSAPALAASVTPRRPGFRRHAPLLVFALAVIALIVAAAKPQRTVAVPVEQAQIMLLTDVSGSMLATDVAPTRLEAARRAGQSFVDKVPKKVRIGVMAFNQAPEVLQSPTTDRADVRAAISRLTSSGGTATGFAIQTALRVLGQTPTQNGKPAPSAIVLLSDGASTRGVDPVAAARQAARLKIPIYTVALGTQTGTITVPRPGGQGGTEVRPVPPDDASLRAIAQASGGQALTAASADDLSQVYQKLGSQLGRKKEPRQITAGFAGVGLALLAFGSILSLRWFGRLI